MKLWPRLFLILCCALIYYTAFGKQNTGQSLLWKISSKEMKKPSYIFGTMHLVCPDDYLWTDTMQATLHKADAVCFEMDLDAPDMMLEIAQAMINTEGKRLQDYFTNEQFVALQQYLADSVGIDISVFQMMKPVALQIMLAERSVGCGKPMSYEANIMEAAKKEKKQVWGLETPQEQVDLFDNVPADSVAKDVLKLIKGEDDGRKEYDRLVAAYKKQDLPALHNILAEAADGGLDPDAFIDARNEKWIPRMVEKMDQGSIFFAVGAGHLWGTKGVITLLRKSGYSVEPVR